MKTVLFLFKPSAQTSLILAMATATLCLTSLAVAGTVGSGNVVSETRSVSGFRGFDLTGSGDVIVTQGDTEGLVIEAEDNILPLLDSTVDKEGILHLGIKEHVGSVSFKKGVVFKLAAKTLDRMELEGSGSIRVGSLSTGSLEVELPGSGSVTVDHLKADKVKTTIEGSGNVKLAGEAHGQKITFDGSGGYEAGDFKTDDTSLQINGSASAKVWAETSLAVEINGSGDIGYKGNPKLKQSINGSGKVHPLGEKNE